MYLPTLGSRLHSSIPKAVIRSTEITRILIALEGRKVVQEFCPESGNDYIKRVSKSKSSLQNHFGSLPNDRDGMSVMAFFLPAMCRVVRGKTFRSFMRRERAGRSWSATNDPLAAICHTQCKVCELSLNSATCIPFLREHTPSIIRNSSRSLAISKSELVR